MVISHGVAVAQVSGTVRGVTFFHLDSATHDFPWVLNNQTTTATRAKIDNILAQYRASGVNWIRLLVAADHFTNDGQSGDVDPVPSAALIQKVNNFMAITRSGANAGKFQIELVLVTHRDSAGNFLDAYPYTHDKTWLKTWLDNLDYTNLGIVMLSGDLSPCLLSGCEGDAGVPIGSLQDNNGKWIKEIWAWKAATYPGLNASYEVIGVQDASSNNPALIKMLANWINAKTPSVPTIAASIYITLSAGSSWQSYANATAAVLDAYATVSSKLLWIDEYGTSLSGGRSASDQDAGYAGFLGASVCWRQNHYPKFAWETGVSSPDWGLISSFSGNTPLWKPSANEVAQYYTLQSCP
jgi:hypothetical protein